MTMFPQGDSLAESPVDWTDIPLGAGQQPNAFGGPGSFQHTKQGDMVRLTDIRRNPSHTWVILSRPPERP